MKKYFGFLCFLGLFWSCQDLKSPTNYHIDSTKGMKTGGVQIVEIKSGEKTFKIWTKRIGNNPKIKLLLLNGGPGMSHEYFECFDSFLPNAAIEYIYYDQLGTGFSDNPNDTTYWDLNRYVEEVMETAKKEGWVLNPQWANPGAQDYIEPDQQDDMLDYIKNN